MRTPQDILVIVDPTASDQPALQKAALLAAAFNARLELFVCDAEAVVESRRALLEKLAQPLRNTGLTVATDCAVGTTLVEGLMRKIGDCHPDLIVKDTHHHNLLRRTLITNTDWQLLRSCAAPVLLAKPKPWAKPAQVLACLDPGHQADQSAMLEQEILAWAGAISTGLGGALHALHVFFPDVLATDSTSTLGGMSSLDGTLIQQSVEAERRAQLASITALVKSAGISPDHIHLLMGSATELLPAEAANLHTDIIVMGAVSRSAIKRVLIGSTAERVLDHLTCDVLVVKSLDFATDLPF